ncbi:MAG: class I SAM-dependent methyltransferase [Fibromonadaceae bacterium]|jgi:ubiquinone/menaquinone biosynthesis C-methylase UbiE|nr:class I SAM-dependent methyltransferase [Fibromonadaceae bacterium]
MFYDTFAKRKRTGLGNFLIEKTFEKLAKIAAKDSPVKILEIGVGRGVFYEQLKKEIPQMDYTGIEASVPLFEAAKSKNINVIKCFIPPFPSLEENSFDLIVMSHVLEHFRDYKEVLDVLSGVNNLLKQNGKFLLFYPCAKDWGKDFFDCDYSHSYITTKNRVDSLLADSGFQVIKRDSYRACFNNFKCFFLLFSKIINCLAFFNIKMRVTFKKNLLTIAQKNELK